MIKVNEIKKNNKTNNKNSSITVSLAMYNDITIQCRVVHTTAGCAVLRVE